MRRPERAPGSRLRAPGRIQIVVAIAVLILMSVVGVALARPGGGESYSGGGGHGGGGGGGGGGGSGDWIFIFEILIRLIWLCVEYPYIGLPLVAIIIVALIAGAIWNARNKDWNSGPPVELAHSATESERADLHALDPDFSWVLFEDFCFRLYATAHGARGNPAAMAALAPYVAEEQRAALLQRAPAGAPVSRVIVGSQRVYDVRAAPDGRSLVGVEFESNYTAGNKSWYTVERWVFARATSARTKPPRPTRDFPCPNCGAPWQAKDAAGGQICAYCNQVVDNGRFDWQVASIDLRHSDPRPPTVTAEVPERGTDLPTYRAPDVDVVWQHLLQDDPALSRETFEARVELCYRILNDSWPENDLAPARGLVSDGLYDYLSYWTTAFATQGMRNALDDMKITRKVIAKVTRDHFYDAVTIRIWGRGKDYVVDRNDHVVRGARHRERPYSEYWTFIRSSARRGPATTAPACPNCGAPLAITMAGSCEHCGVHVTAGEFDWVLSKIEQDDSYRG